jgi:hypothetical protein
MSRIDYSKWNHLEDSDDDSNDDSPPEIPRVTKLEQPSRITTQADGTLLVQPSTESPATNKRPVTKEDEIPLEWTEKGDHVILENNLQLWWSQDRYAVTLRIRLASEMKISSVQVEPILPYQDRHCATGTQTSVLSIYTPDGTVWWEAQLPHPVHLAEDDDNNNNNNNTVDWTILTRAHEKYLTIVLYKATPMAGMFIWWKRPFLQCPELEIDSNDNSRTFQQAWAEAHQQFTETIRPRHTL